MKVDFWNSRSKHHANSVYDVTCILQFVVAESFLQGRIKYVSLLAVALGVLLIYRKECDTGYPLLPVELGVLLMYRKECDTGYPLRPYEVADL